MMKLPKGSSLELLKVTSLFFDIEPNLPCHAMVINCDYALLIKQKVDRKTVGKTDAWERVGILGLQGETLKDVDWGCSAAQKLVATVTIY